jgi:hypothetical protein
MVVALPTPMTTKYLASCIVLFAACVSESVLVEPDGGNPPAVDAGNGGEDATVPNPIPIEGPVDITGMTPEEAAQHTAEQVCLSRQECTQYIQQNYQTEQWELTEFDPEFDTSYEACVERASQSYERYLSCVEFEPYEIIYYNNCFNTMIEGGCFTQDEVDQLNQDHAHPYDLECSPIDIVVSTCGEASDPGPSPETMTLRLFSQDGTQASFQNASLYYRIYGYDEYLADASASIILEGTVAVSSLESEVEIAVPPNPHRLIDQGHGPVAKRQAGFYIGYYLTVSDDPGYCDDWSQDYDYYDSGIDFFDYVLPSYFEMPLEKRTEPDCL